MHHRFVGQGIRTFEKSPDPQRLAFSQKEKESLLLCVYFHTANRTLPGGNKLAAVLLFERHSNEREARFILDRIFDIFY